MIDAKLSSLTFAVIKNIQSSILYSLKIERALHVGLGISDKKQFRGRRNRRNKWLVQTEFLQFRGTKNSRNSVPNNSAEEKNARNSGPETKIVANSRNSSTEEKTTQNSSPWNKNRSKLSKFCSGAISWKRKHHVCTGVQRSRNDVNNMTQKSILIKIL